MRKTVLAATACFLLLLSLPARAADNGGAAIVADTVIVRPLGIASLVLGTAGFLVSLPFALTSGSVDTAARELVGEPFRFTFTRPLGDFSRKDGFGQDP